MAGGLVERLAQRQVTGGGSGRAVAQQGPSGSISAPMAPMASRAADQPSHSSNPRVPGSMAN